MKEVSCSSQTVKRFSGKHVLLTGASGSLGRAFGLHLAQCGVRTLVLSGRNEIFLQHLADECREISTSFIEVHVVPCDLSEPTEVTKLGLKALSLCNINVLINNAAVMIRDDFGETSPEVDQMVMQVNFLSGVALAKMVVPEMIKNRGKGCILWISSVQGFYSLPGCSTFAASKFAIQGYCEAVRAELAKTGVSVHVASPGFIRTKFESAAGTDMNPRAISSSRRAKGALPDKVAADILNAVAKGRRDFLVASSFKDRTSMLMRFLSPTLWNKHLIKVHEENLRLAAERAANEISVYDEFDEDKNEQLKDKDSDTVSVISHQSEHNQLKSASGDSGVVIVEAPSNLSVEKAQNESKEENDADDDSVESVGSQLVRLAAGH